MLWLEDMVWDAVECVGGWVGAVLEVTAALAVGWFLFRFIFG